MSAYSFVVTKNAAKDIQKLSPILQKRLALKLKFYLNQSDPLASAKHLVGTQNGNFRWRIGDYRVVFDVDTDKIVILRVQHRREVYRD